VHLPETLPSEEALRAQIQDHPRLGAQRALIASRQAALTMQRAQTAQDLTVGGGVRFFREGNDAAFVAGVSMPLPMRRQNQGNIRAAREFLAGAEETARATEYALRSEFTHAWLELTTAHRIAQHWRGEARSATEESHAIVRRAYDQGQLPFIDVLDAERALIAVRQKILEAEIAYARALVRVESFGDRAFPLTTALFSGP
jgi:cobalt-zinc-cadmium efflux system outer membrane protein